MEVEWLIELDHHSLEQSTIKASKIVKPMNPKSKSFAEHDAGIQSVLDRIAAGEGDFEVDFEFGPGPKTAFLPLLYFVRYIQRDQYPHPRLLEYISTVFDQILRGEPFDKSFGLARKRGRRPVHNEAKQRTLRFTLGYSLYSKVHRKNNPLSLNRAIARELRNPTISDPDFPSYSDKGLEKIYYEFKADFEAGLEIGRQFSLSAREGKDQ